MAQAYTLLTTLHNAVGGLALLLVIAAVGWLLFTARTTTTGSALVLRLTSISVSLQALIGILLLIVGLVMGIGGLWLFWYHYVIGIVAVGLVSAFAARARRAPDSEARRYGLLMLLGLAAVLGNFVIGTIQRGG